MKNKFTTPSPTGRQETQTIKKTGSLIHKLTSRKTRKTNKEVSVRGILISVSERGIIFDVKKYLQQYFILQSEYKYSKTVKLSVDDQLRVNGLVVSILTWYVMNCNKFHFFNVILYLGHSK